MTRYPLWRRPFGRAEFAVYVLAAAIGAAIQTWGPSDIGMMWVLIVVCVGLAVAQVRASMK